MCLAPICFHQEDHLEEVNWTPLSEVMTAGTLYLARQVHKSIQNCLCCGLQGNLFWPSCRSDHHGEKVQPPLVAGRGPIRSTWTCENLAEGIGIFSTMACSCTKTLALWQEVHCLHHSRTSAASPGHTNLALTKREVTLFPACARPCTCVKTAWRHCSGTHGLSTPVDPSQQMLTPSTATL